jgi:hypothetical protein
MWTVRRIYTVTVYELILLNTRAVRLPPFQHGYPIALNRHPISRCRLGRTSGWEDFRRIHWFTEQLSQRVIVRWTIGWTVIVTVELERQMFEVFAGGNKKWR